MHWQMIFRLGFGPHPSGSCMHCLADRCLVHSEDLMEPSTSEALHQSPVDRSSLPGPLRVLDTVTSARMACLEGKAKGESGAMCISDQRMLLPPAYLSISIAARWGTMPA